MKNLYLKISIILLLGSIMPLKEDFFARPSLDVARDLLGRRLVRKIGSRTYTVMITETGAYEGGSREGLSYAPGKIYVAIFRGGHATLAIGAEAEGKPSVVTVRRAYPLEGVSGDLGGSARLTKALSIDKKLDGKSISGDELYIEGLSIEPSRIIQVTPDLENMAENCLSYFRLR